MLFFLYTSHTMDRVLLNRRKREEKAPST